MPSQDKKNKKAIINNFHFAKPWKFLRGVEKIFENIWIKITIFFLESSNGMDLWKL